MQLNLLDLRRLAEQPPNQQGFPSLAELLALSQQRQGVRAPTREINPGVTWGGRDRNAIMPSDVMENYFLPQLPENP